MNFRDFRLLHALLLVVMAQPLAAQEMPAELMHGETTYGMILRGACPDAPGGAINLWAFAPDEEGEPLQSAPTVHLSGDGTWNRLEIFDTSRAYLVNELAEDGSVVSHDGQIMSWAGQDAEGTGVSLRITCPG